MSNKLRNVTRHVGRFEIVERMRNSTNGNPRYAVWFAGWNCVTKPDSDLAYNLQRYDGKECIGTIGTYYGKATLLSLSLKES